jgi:hypothetical protein
MTAHQMRGNARVERCKTKRRAACGGSLS